jgi:tripartite-type tricarboxylate transporter receptor subunit TctC
MISRRAVLALPAAAALPWSAHATDYPVRAIRFIVPVGTGSGTDLLGRYIAKELGQTWKVSTVVENKVGGGGVIGTDTVAKSPPDGYTLLMTYASHYSNPWVIDKLPYDTIKDIAPLAMVASSVLIAIVAPESPFKSMRDVYEEARRNPGKLSYGSAGVGTTGHVCGALMNSMANVSVNHVPYKQTSQVAMDAAAGVVSLSFSGVPTALPLIKAGRLRALAVTSPKRSVHLPDTPTMDETGLKGYDVTSPIWAMGPAGLPPDVVQKLSTEILRAAGRPEFKDLCASLGLEVALEDAAASHAKAAGELEKWRKLVALTAAKTN